MNNNQLLSNYYSMHRDELISFIAVRIHDVYEAYEHYIQTSDIRLQTSDDDTESIFSAQQIMERMERSLARLPKACCEIYQLHIYEGMKVSAIAKELSLPYKQVENRLGQARKAVRQQLRCCV